MDDYFQSWVFQPDEGKDAYWAVWLQENPDKVAHVDSARTVLQQFDFATHKLGPDEVALLWERIKKEEIHASNRSQRYRWYVTAAATLLVGIFLVYWATRPTLIEYHTAFGETRTVVLPDNSRVTLNSNSLLRLSSDWDKESVREVWLDGEAFFSVTHKKNNQPFRVKTNEGVGIEVLGTTFNVYHRTAATKVVLNTGKIRLSLPKTDKKIVMKPGDFIEYNKKHYVRRSVDPKVYTSWTENNLVLNHTTLRELVAMLNDNYGLTVGVSEHLLTQTVSGSMPLTNADELVVQIAKAFRLKIVREGETTLLKEIDTETPITKYDNKLN